MATGEQPLLAPELFRPLAKLVDQFGIRYIVESGTGPSSSGMEAAARLGLRGYTADVFLPCVERARNLYAIKHGFVCMHADSLTMLRQVLPTLDGPTFFWLDGHCPTDQSCLPGGIFPVYDEMKLIRELKRGFERDVIWLDDIAMIDVEGNPARSSWDVDLAGRRWQGEKEHAWQEYLDIFADTHTTEVVDCMLRLTPK